MQFERILKYHWCTPLIARAFNRLLVNYVTEIIDQFRFIKIQPETIDLSTRLRGIATEFVGFIPRSLVLRSIVLG